MKRGGKIYKNYYDTKPTDKHILITGNLSDVICDDFCEYLEDHHIKLFSEDAEKRIDDYLMSLFYQMQDEIEEETERETMENIIKKILLDYCQSIPF